MNFSYLGSTYYELDKLVSLVSMLAQKENIN